MKNKFTKRNRTLLLRFSIYVVTTAIVLCTFCISGFGQSVDVKKVVADLELEIRRAMIEGNIPSATVALVSGDKVIWTGAYGESNLCPGDACFIY